MAQRNRSDEEVIDIVASVETLQLDRSHRGKLPDNFQLGQLKRLVQEGRLVGSTHRVMPWGGPKVDQWHRPDSVEGRDYIELKLSAREKANRGITED